jgi:hypothetical protein
MAGTAHTYAPASLYTALPKLIMVIAGNGA